MPESEALQLRVAYQEPENAAKALRELKDAAYDAEKEAKTLEKEFRGAARPIALVGTESDKTGRKAQSLATEFRRMARSAANSGDPVGVLAQRIGALGQTLGGLAGTIVGGAVSYGMIALVQHFREVSTEAKSAEEAISEFKSAMSSFRNEVALATEDTRAMIDKFGDLAGEIREVARQMAKVQLARALSGVSEALEAAIPKMAQLNRLIDRRAEATERMAQEDAIAAMQTAEEIEHIDRQVEKLAKNMGLSSEQAAELKVHVDGINAAAAANDTEALAKAAGRAANFLLDAHDSAADIPPALQDAIDQLVILQRESARATTEAEELNNEWAQIKRAIADAVAGAPQSGWLSGAIADASELAGKMWDVVDAMLSAFRSDGGEGLESSARPTSRPEGLGRKPKSGGGRAGGRSAAASAAEAQSNAIQDVIRSLQQETAAVLMSEQSRRLYDELRQAGVELYSKEGQEIADLVEGLYSLEEAQRQSADAAQQAGEWNRRFLEGLANGRKGMADFLKDLAMLNLQLALLGKSGTGGLLGPALSSITGNFAVPSFEGGGYTGSGARSGGIDGRGGFMAVIHPNETVVDHKQGGRGGGTIVQVINNTGQAVEEERSQGPNGEEMVRLIVGRQMGRGDYDSSMSRYGSRPSKVVR